MPSTLPPAPAPTPVPSITSLLAALWKSAPLPLLLEATGAELIDANITDAEFFGGVVQRKGGRIFLMMPPGRPETERDLVARDLLARILNVKLPGQKPTQRIAAL